MNFEEDQTNSELGPASNPLLNAPYVCSSTGSLELLGTQEHVPSTLLDFETLYRKPEEERTLCEIVREAVAKKWKKFSIKKTLAGNFPTLSKMRSYKVREYLPNDVVAGLTVGITMIPQGMAFASLSTLPPIVGLYISFFASVAYFFLGTCHQLSWGCVAVLSILTGNILDDYDAKTRAALGMVGRSSGQPKDSIGASLAAPLETSSMSSSVTQLLGNVTSEAATTLLFNNSDLPMALSVERKIEVACAVTMISGIILAVLGKLGLGRLTSFMSDSLITSFTVGVSFHVVTSQMKTALGLDHLPRQNGVGKFVMAWVSMLSSLHQVNPATLTTSVLCIVALYTVKRFINEKFKSRLRVPVPIELFVVIVATVVSYYISLNEQFSVRVVREIPVGVPKPRWPDLSLGVNYITDGLVIIIVSFTQNVAMAKLMGLKHNYRIDANQEMFACGAVSVVCSVFSGYISGPSVSRSLVQDGAGGKTQVASLFAAGLVLLVIMVIGPYFYHLPRCVLAAIIIVNLRSMFLKLLTLPDLWRKSRVDALVWIITCLATVLLETDVGLLVGIIACVLFVLIRSQISAVDVVSEISLGDNVSVWRSEDRYVGGKVSEGVRAVRINTALYFANAEIVTDQVFKKTGINPIKLARTMTVDINVRDTQDVVVDDDQSNHVTDLRNAEKEDDSCVNGVDYDNDVNRMSSKIGDNGDHIVFEKPASPIIPFSVLMVDLSLVTFLDVMGVQALEFLLAKYQVVGIDVYFVNAQEKCIDTLQKCGFLRKNKDRVYVTMGAALRHI